MIKPITIQADDSLNDAVNVRTHRIDTIFVVNNKHRLLGF